MKKNVDHSSPPIQTPIRPQSSQSCKKKPDVSPVTPPNCASANLRYFERGNHRKRRRHPASRGRHPDHPLAAAARPASASAAVAVRRWTPLVKAQSMPDFRAFGRFTAHRPDSAREHEQRANQQNMPRGEHLVGKARVGEQVHAAVNDRERAAVGILHDRELFLARLVRRECVHRVEITVHVDAACH